MKLPQGYHIHMVGICGVGMAGVARLLAARGHVVSGCDSKLNQLSVALRSAGIKIYNRHSIAHIDALPVESVVVVTTAVSDDEPEVVAARERGIPVIRRGEALASLASQSCAIAVCGTHGKTTTACFAARLLQELGADPGWCIGGFTTALGNVADPGQGDLLVVEADESDGTLRHYSPTITVVNNIDIDHLEHFDGEEELLECFRDVLRKSRGSICVCADDMRAARVVRECAAVRVLDYGLTADAALRAENVECAAGGCSFDLVYRGVSVGHLCLNVGGVHNVVNALGAAAAALSCGYAVEEIFGVLPTACSELPGRRFEEIGERDGVRYVVDYAHHPVELRAAVQMALDCSPHRVIAVFQPHRYSRTLAMGASFPAAFEGVDQVVLLPVYAASELALRGGDTCDLYAHFRAEPDAPAVTLCRSLRECAGYLRHIAAPGDLVLIAGAGDVIDLRELIFENAERVDFKAIADQLNREPRTEAALNGALQPFSILPTQAHASLVVRAGDADAVAATIALCCKHSLKWRAAGAGFNTFFSDCALESCVISFKGQREPAAARDLYMTESSDESVIISLSCDTSAPKLMEMLSNAGLSGLEFMSGIPGTLGGWLAMNAGAQGGCIADCVQSIEFVRADGEIAECTAEECGFSYRRCAVLKQGFALSCRLLLKKSTPESVKRRMREYSAQRIPLAGLRTAGSVFRNPAGDHAGRLLERAGCRGLRVGCAAVTAFHANIIVAERGCTASDVLALTQMMRNLVSFSSGIELETEITGF